ncbi:MAG TPA: FtsX-like permease family protein, partial [Bacteroidetes bacterium]|nr:FtsX-like permease family protein [Bacteroidota bacterium]
GKVYSIDYISKDQALEKFSSENKDDPVIAGALKEIGENPLLSSLVVRANNQADYSQLAEEIGNKYKDDINNINYGKNKDVIEKLNKITSSAKKVGLILGIVFVAIAILITFNTIRLSLFVRRKEFDIMRLVGASNLYIKAPSIFEGIFYGVFASILAILAVVATAYTAMPMVIKGLITKDQIINFYLNNLLFIGGVILVVGLLIGIVSSMIAIKKYLKA